VKGWAGFLLKYQKASYLQEFSFAMVMFNGAVHMWRVKDSEVKDRQNIFRSTDVANRCGASHQVKQRG